MSIVTKPLLQSLFLSLFQDKNLHVFAKSTEIPISAVISETDVLQKLVVEKRSFSFSVFILCLQGLEGIFECVFLILPY